MRKALSILLVTTSVLILAIVFFIGYGISQQPKDASQSEWKTFVSKELGFTINYPSTWKPQTETSNVSFALEKKAQDFFAAYVRVTKNFSGPDFDALGAFNNIYDAKPNTKIENPNQGDILIDATVTKVENLEVDGQKATKVLEESKIPGPFYAERIYTLRDNQVWVISSVAPTKEELDEQKPLFAKALTTFKFLSK